MRATTTRNLLAAASALALVSVSCGGDSEPDTQGPTDAPTTPDIAQTTQPTQPQSPTPQPSPRPDDEPPIIVTTETTGRFGVAFLCGAPCPDSVEEHRSGELLVRVDHFPGGKSVRVEIINEGGRSARQLAVSEEVELSVGACVYSPLEPSHPPGGNDEQTEENEATLADPQRDDALQPQQEEPSANAADDEDRRPDPPSGEDEPYCQPVTDLNELVIEVSPQCDIVSSTDQTGRIHCPLGDLPPGEQRTVTTVFGQREDDVRLYGTFDLTITVTAES